MSKKISELSAAGAIVGSELVAVVQSGATVRTTVSAMAELPLGNPVADAYLLSSTAAGVRSWAAPSSLIINSIKDSTDPTKVAQFDASGITTGTTRTITLPNSNTTLPIASQILTFIGPTAARTITLPDASFTVARTDAANTFTGGATISSGSLTLSGNQSAAAWTTSGLRLVGIAGTLTDTTSSGTVAAAYTNKLGGNTIAASSATTFTNYISGYFSDPIAGTNVTITNKIALGADSASFGTSTPFKVSTAGVVSGGSGWATSGANANITSLSGLTGTITSTEGTIVANTPALAITQTWNNSGVSFIPLTIAITDTASTGVGSGFANFTIGGASVFGVNKSGIVNANTEFTVGSTFGTANAMTMSSDRLFTSSGADLYIGSSGLNNQIKIANKFVQYNAINTAGNGIPAIVAAARVTAQSAANASIATYTTPASDGSYEISMNMNVTVATAISTSLNCTYTDESNTSRTMIIPVTSLAGTFLTNGLVIATGAYETPVFHIRTKASTAITLYTASGTFTGVTYTAEGVIKQTQ